jgi:hypothetical protein
VTVAVAVAARSSMAKGVRKTPEINVGTLSVRTGGKEKRRKRG